jgi:SAM-dependent methyltransferase
MAGSIAERVHRYILDGSDDDLRRLLLVSELAAEQTRATFRRAGVDEGWSAIECGCGPLGGLAILAEAVGPNGRVLGVDFSEPSVERARSVLGALDVENVEVVVGDVNEADGTSLGGPFDLAYSRQFLMHQPDPLHSLRSIGGLLRPGGLLIALEPLRNLPPRSHPHLDALDSCWELLHQVRDRTGVPPAAVEDLAQTATAAGFEVLDTGGWFAVTAPEEGFGFYAATTAALKDRATELGVASGAAVDELVTTLRAASADGYRWVASAGCLDLTLRRATEETLSAC